MLENIFSPFRMEEVIIHFLYIPLTLPLPSFIKAATSAFEGLLTIPAASLCAFSTALKQSVFKVIRYTAADNPSRHLRMNMRLAAFRQPLLAAFSAGRFLNPSANVLARLFSSIRILFLKLRYSLNGEVAGNVPPPT